MIFVSSAAGRRRQGANIGDVSREPIYSILVPPHSNDPPRRSISGEQSTALRTGSDGLPAGSRNSLSSRLNVDRIITEIQLSFNIPITETSTATLEPLSRSNSYSYCINRLQKGGGYRFDAFVFFFIFVPA